MSIVGDVCVSEGFGVPDIEQIDKEIIKYFSSCDLVVGNLECPITDSTERIEKLGPNLRGAPNLLALLKSMHFNLLTLGNNHIMDFGVQGLIDTVKKCNDQNIWTTGVNLPEIGGERDYYIFDKAHLRVGILNVAEFEFGSSVDNGPGALVYDVVGTFRKIQRIKGECDNLIVMIHGGIENFNLPSTQQVNEYRLLADAGADMIVCNHSHRISGYEIWNGVPIFYGIGNFMFAGTGKPIDWHVGMQLNVSFRDKLVFDYHFIYFDNKDGVLKKLTGDREKKWRSKVDALSEIIKHDVLLEEAINQFAKSQTNYYLQILHNKSSRFHRILVGRLKLSKYIFSRRHNVRLFNYFNCDSHAYVIRKILGLMR